MRVQLNGYIYAPPTRIFLKYNLITKGHTASAVEVAGPQQKKVWEAMLYTTSLSHLTDQEGLGLHEEHHYRPTLLWWT